MADARKNAVVLNHYLYVLGGGERSSLAYAKALADLGYDTRLVAVKHPDVSRAVDMFGDEFAGLRIESLPPDEIPAALKADRIDVFVNHSFMTIVSNPARVGLYVQMFPVSRIGRNDSPTYENLQSYQRLLCCSSFTRKYTCKYWDYPPERSVVLHPPLGRDIHRESGRTGLWMHRKKKQFLNVGRFNPILHNKNQCILIEAFLDARSRHPALRDWSLVLLGPVNVEEASGQYYRKCVQLAASEPGAVRIETAVSSRRLIKLMRESYGYVHGAGAFVKETESPEKCEHFGLAIVEAMACGCIPLVFHGGGVFDVLKIGSGGLSYLTFAGLVDGFIRLASLYGTEAGRRKQAWNRNAARELGQAEFTRKLDRILKESESP